MIPPIKVLSDEDRTPYEPDAPMTARQADILRDLADKLNEPFDSALTQKQAQARIAALEELKDQ